MWFVHNKVILTKDNLAKRRWEGSKRCCFCDQNEIIQHLFLKCPLAKLLRRMIHVAFMLVHQIVLIRYLGRGLIGWSQVPWDIFE